MELSFGTAQQSNSGPSFFRREHSFTKKGSHAQNSSEHSRGSASEGPGPPLEGPLKHCKGPFENGAACQDPRSPPRPGPRLARVRDSGIEGRYHESVGRPRRTVTRWAVGGPWRGAVSRDCTEGPHGATEHWMVHRLSSAFLEGCTCGSFVATLSKGICGPVETGPHLRAGRDGPFLDCAFSRNRRNARLGATQYWGSASPSRVRMGGPRRKGPSEQGAVRARTAPKDPRPSKERDFNFQGPRSTPALRSFGPADRPRGPSGRSASRGSARMARKTVERAVSSGPFRAGRFEWARKTVDGAGRFEAPSSRRLV
ncbi:hypothetical protein M885DRAFT_209508 [Pelagophyceae sp. CCMP2097]|nr:hypothetical protein M885DRAFT_209508 [Pelagophyceae sp. CCMP2097]